MKHETQWPADAPEWANKMLTVFWDGKTDYVSGKVKRIYADRPKPKDYCGMCGEWLGGPVECCGESHLKPPVTKDEAVAVRTTRKPAKQKIDADHIADAGNMIELEK